MYVLWELVLTGQLVVFIAYNLHVIVGIVSRQHLYSEPGDLYWWDFATYLCQFIIVAAILSLASFDNLRAAIERAFGVH